MKTIILSMSLMLLLANVTQNCNDKPMPAVTPSASETPILTNQL